MSRGGLVWPLSLLGALASLAAPGCTSLTGSEVYEPAPQPDAPFRYDETSADGVVPEVATDGALEAGSDVAPDASALAPAPNQVHCAATLCDLSSGRVCCTPAAAATCTVCKVPEFLACDEAADCSPGEVCCFGAKGDQSTCRKDGCSGGSQACMTDAECKSGKCTPFFLGTTTLGRCS